MIDAVKLKIKCRELCEKIENSENPIEKEELLEALDVIRQENLRQLADLRKKHEYYQSLISKPKCTGW